MTEKRKYCGECGATVVSGSKFCSACDTDLARFKVAAASPDETAQPSDPEAPKRRKRRGFEEHLEHRQVPTAGSWPVSSWPYALLGGLLLAVVLAVYRSGDLSNLSSADLAGGVVDFALGLGVCFLVLWGLIALFRRISRPRSRPLSR